MLIQGYLCPCKAEAVLAVYFPGSALVQVMEHF